MQFYCRAPTFLNILTEIIPKYYMRYNGFYDYESASCWGDSISS